MSTDYRRWICEACGYIYDEAKGDVDSGLAPGTRYEDIPYDWMCPLCGMRTSDLRLLPEAPSAEQTAAPARRSDAPRGKCRGGDDYVVIIGAGVAGWSVAETLRAADYDSPILLVSACSGASYPKPALTTALANGKSADDLIQQDADSKAEALGVDLRTDTRVIKVDTDKRRLVTSKGAISYGKLVLALGARQRDVALQGDAVDQVFKVNDLVSYRCLRKRLDAGAKRVTLLGAGLIGCEFAEDLSSAGLQVNVVDPAYRPLARLLPQEMSPLLQRRLAEKGVVWHLGQSLDRLDRSGTSLRATLSSGDAYETDLVIMAAGMQPQTALAEKMGLRIDGGIWTDYDMRTSDPDVFALGDCAAVDGRVYGYIEPIKRQAQAIAGAIVGIAQPFSPSSPLIRVKTPSFPLSICLPAIPEHDVSIEPRAVQDGCRLDYMQNGKLVGFVLTDNCSANAGVLYQSVSG